MEIDIYYREQKYMLKCITKLNAFVFYQYECSNFSAMFYHSLIPFFILCYVLIMIIIIITITFGHTQCQEVILYELRDNLLCIQLFINQFFLFSF